MSIRCCECDFFMDVNSCVCCTRMRIGFRYSSANRLSKIYDLSKRCDIKSKERCKFNGEITEKDLEDFEKIYRDTSKSAQQLIEEHNICKGKWDKMARIIRKRTGYQRPRHDSTHEDSHIIKRKGARQNSFILKYANEHYGSYKSKDDAIRAKNMLASVGWDKSKLESIRKQIDYGE